MSPIRRPAAALLVAFLAVPLLISPAAPAAEKDKGKSKDSGETTPFKPETFSGLKLRGIGPALTSGRIVDIAVHPADHDIWYVGVASGGVWKTTNAGTTWSPLFDAQGSYSIGCLAIDPRNPLTIWVGSGENNSQRSVAYGDGVYRSDDGGKSWQNMGLKNSEHIGRIVVDPWDSKVVWVAAQGPLWSTGGDRGLYKTTDGGATWTLALKAGEFAGVSDVALDPRNSEVVYAAAYQRHRKVWTLINGGPESALHKSVDGGKTWKKLENGLPKEELGRIGLAISPVNPDVVYAVVEAAGKAGGFFRSVDAGGSWEKMSDYVPGGPQYYNELIPDPRDVDRVYSMDVFMKVTDDAGKTFRNAGEKSKHVDNHALWIDPTDTDHLINGCDGGVYESFDRAATWKYVSNLPVTQFYKVTTDNAEPFYNIYGGTQDNFSLGGPSRTRTIHGITNTDWFVTLGGDGFQTQVDPKDPNIVYSILQYGVIVRHDRKTGETLDIQPQPEEGEALRWNWDSPLIISPHSHTRLYYAANRLFRSEDRGDSWRALGPDLTRQIDRNRLKVAGRVWSVDSVAKNSSTSFYGNIVTLSESPLVEGLLYVGTDDGLVQVSEDGGTTWRRIERFPGVPEFTYVSRVVASQHDASVVYATFENHKEGDFKPYVLKSRDRGASWTAIAGNLPERGSVYVLAEDHVKADLLFAGTEFGLFFTPDGGGRWVQLKGGMPTIQVRDLAIQKRENDLVAATFGRGFYVLDDYAPLRDATADLLGREASLLPVKAADLYVPSSPLGVRDKSFQGETYFTAPNPPFGATFTWYLKDEIKTRKAKRREAEKETAKKGGDVFYPSWEDLRAEDREEDPAIILTVTDEDGGVVRRLTGPVTAGFNRVAWDLRYPPFSPTSLTPPNLDNPFFDPPVGPLAAPGTYKVAIAKRVDGAVTPLAEPRTFTVAPLGEGSLPAPDRKALLAFQRRTGRLQRAVLGAVKAVDESKERLSYLKKAILETPGADQKLGDEARRLEVRLADLAAALTGDTTIGSRNEPVPLSIVDRVSQIVGGHWTTTSDATATHRRLYDQAASRFAGVLDSLRTAAADLQRLEASAEAAGAPWTPGRLPEWRPE